MLFRFSYKPCHLLYMVRLISLIALAGFLGSLPSTRAHAEATCSNDLAPRYSATFPVPSDTYNVYGKLTAPGQLAMATGYAQEVGDNPVCIPVGSTLLTSKEWKLLGSVTASGASTMTFQLESVDFPSVPNANRPQLLLVSRDKPVCTPVVDCTISNESGGGYILPRATANEQNALYAGIAHPPENDTLVLVRYYVDYREQYKTKKLQPFDMRYVDNSGRLLQRVAEYASGQHIIYEETVPDTHMDSIGNAAFRMSRAQTALYFALSALVLFCVLTIGTYFSLRALMLRKLWLEHHGLIKPQRLARINIVILFFQNRLQPVLRIIFLIVIIPLLGVILLIALNRYAVTAYNVSGSSMTPTFHTSQRVIVNLLPVTLARMNQKIYIPQRGDVIIARNIYGNMGFPAQDETTHTIIKRVIGLPGERVHISDNVITIYNKEHPEGFVPDNSGLWNILPSADSTFGTVDLSLDSDEIFISGDNRGGSVDSRYNGPLDTRYIIGKVQ